MKENFKAQVELLLDVIKHVTVPSKFALKGGTAINLFINNMPRLSVDIDLAYLPINTRLDALKDINQTVSIIIADIKQQYPTVNCIVNYTKDGFPSKIQIIRDRVEVKVDINNVLRGAVYSPVELKLCDKAQDLFGRYVKVQSLSVDDIYAGKFCAALDRQHPRDLFDVMVFFQNNKITKQLKDAFLIYLLSAGRPIVELLKPNFLNQEDTYSKEFVGMTSETISYNQLCDARTTLTQEIHSNMNDTDKQFLVSFESGKPNWALFNIPDARNLPAIQWRMVNLEKLDAEKKRLHVTKLIDALYSVR